jgi:hypothetical protein
MTYLITITQDKPQVYLISNLKLVPFIPSYPLIKFFEIAKV